MRSLRMPCTHDMDRTLRTRVNARCHQSYEWTQTADALSQHESQHIINELGGDNSIGTCVKGTNGHCLHVHPVSLCKGV